MVRKKERLTREEFNRFFSLGKRSHSPAFQCVYTEHPTFHASVVVPKKVLNHAVSRNKLRRSVYNLLKGEGVKKGVYILIAKKNAANITKKELQNEVRTLIGLEKEKTY